MPSQLLSPNMTSPEYIQMYVDKVSFNLPRKRTWRNTTECCLFRVQIYIQAIYKCRLYILHFSRGGEAIVQKNKVKCMDTPMFQKGLLFFPHRLQRSSLLYCPSCRSKYTCLTAHPATFFSFHDLIHLNKIGHRFQKKKSKSASFLNQQIVGMWLSLSRFNSKFPWRWSIVFKV